jgi:phosphoribosylformimino-5-aminoimidazole carboxamide ribotide isomerase
MRIIPAIDIINGKCIRLTKGDFATEKIYNLDPVEVAKEFEDNGIQYLHLVDLDGARARKIMNYKVLNAITRQTKLRVDFGGGLNSNQDIKIAFDNGASQITGGSVAVHNPSLFVEWIQTYGADKIILGADFNLRKIAIHGWVENTQIDVVDFIKHYQSKGIQYVICTDISKDGMLQGPANQLYSDIISKSEVRLIASGGISNIEDLRKLKAIGCEGAVIGKAIYENYISLSELRCLC